MNKLVAVSVLVIFSISTAIIIGIGYIFMFLAKGLSWIAMIIQRIGMKFLEHMKWFVIVSFDEKTLLKK